MTYKHFNVFLKTSVHECTVADPFRQFSFFFLKVRYTICKTHFLFYIRGNCKFRKKKEDQSISYTQYSSMYLVHNSTILNMSEKKSLGDQKVYTLKYRRLFCGRCGQVGAPRGGIYRLGHQNCPIYFNREGEILLSHPVYHSILILSTIIQIVTMIYRCSMLKKLTNAHLSPFDQIVIIQLLYYTIHNYDEVYTSQQHK